MAAKKTATKSTKSRVSQTAKKKSFIHRPVALVVAVLLIAVVAITGILIYRFSFAANWSGTAYDQTVNNVYWQNLSDGTTGRCIQTDASGLWCTGPRYKFDSGLAQWRRQNDGRCATIWPNNVSGKELTNYAYLTAGTVYHNGQRIRISETNVCDKN